MAVGNSTLRATPSCMLRTAPRWGAYLVLSLLLLGCASKGGDSSSSSGGLFSPSPTRLAGTLNVATKINPDLRGRPSPVVLRLYELSAAQRFKEADFFALYDQEATTLGNELIAREEMEVKPGDQRPLSKTLSPQTRFVGVLAAFRNIEKAQWRAIVAVPTGKKTSVNMALDNLTLSVTPIK